MATGIAEAFASAIKPRPRPRVSEWIAQNLQIPIRGNAVAGRYDATRTPYMVEVLDCAGLPEVRRLHLTKDEQSGGTLGLLCGLLAYWIVNDPAPTLVVYPDEKAGERVNREKLIPTLMATPEVVKHVTTRKWDMKSDELRFDEMTIFFGSSRSPSQLETFAYKRVLIDEVGRCRPDTLSVVAGRVNTYHDSLIVSWGTPEDENGQDWKSFLDGDRRTLFVPCLSCHQYYRRQFSHIKWPHGPDGPLAEPPESVERKAHARCPHCDHPHDGGSNLIQLQKCLWVPEGYEVRDGVVLDADGNPPKPVASRSYHKHGCYNPFRPNVHGYLAGEFVRSGGRATRAWVNRRLGEPWKNPGRTIKASELMLLAGSKERRDGAAAVPVYRMGQVPMGVDRPGPAVLTIAFDVQKASFYYEVIGWSDPEKGEPIQWLIDCGTVKRSAIGGAGMGVLDAAMLRTYPIVNVQTGEVTGEMPITFGWIDSGHWTTEVYDYTRGKLKGAWRDGVGPRVFSTKGEPNRAAYESGKVYRWSRPEVDAIGKPLPASVDLLLFCGAAFKAELMEAIGAEVEMVRTQSPGSRRLLFPENVPQAYMLQLCSEEFAVWTEKGKKRQAWRIRQGIEENHWLDCRVMNWAGARAVNVYRVLAEVQQAQPTTPPPPPPAVVIRRQPAGLPQMSGWLRA